MVSSGKRIMGMTISEPMARQLNEQITHELFSAHLYLAMSCAFNHMGLPILAKWFNDQADEERAHAMKIVNYVQDVGAPVRIDALLKPQGFSDSATEIVSVAVEHEVTITRQINELVALAESEKDYATRSFLQWFLDEQVEEVATVNGLLQLVKMGGDKHMLEVEARVANMRQPSV